MTCLAPRSPTLGRREQQAGGEPGKAAGRRGTHLAAAAGWCRGGVSSTMQGAEEDGGQGKGIEREHLDVWAAVLPGEGEQPLAGEGSWSVSVPA